MLEAAEAVLQATITNDYFQRLCFKYSRKFIVCKLGDEVDMV